MVRHNGSSKSDPAADCLVTGMLDGAPWYPPGHHDRGLCSPLQEPLPLSTGLPTKGVITGAPSWNILSKRELAHRSFPGCPHLLFLFIYDFFESCFVFTAARGLSLVTASGGCSLVVVCRLLLWGLLLLQSMVSRECRLQ